MSLKEVCKILENKKLSTVLDTLDYDKNRDLICKVLLLSMILNFMLLFIVPMNGIFLYHALQYHFKLPAYSDFMIGCISYIVFIILKDYTNKDNLLSLVSNTICSFCAMVFSFYYMRGSL